MSATLIGSNLYRLQSDIRSEGSVFIAPSIVDPTCAVFNVDLGQRRAEVRITLTPFRLQNHPGQVFFGVSALCGASLTTAYEEIVRYQTNNVLSRFFPQVCCDLEGSGWFRTATISPVNPSPSPCQQILSSNNAGELDNNPYEVEDAASAGQIASTVKSQINWRRTRARPVREIETRLPRRQQDQTYDAFIELFEQACSNFRRKDSKATIEFLAGCIRSAAPYLPRVIVGSGATEDCRIQQACQPREKWRSGKWQRRAVFANTVVDGLITAWGSKAYLIYDVLAASSGWFRPIRDISDERRRDIAAKVISELRAEVPAANTHAKYDFHPEHEMATLLDLPPAATKDLLLPFQDLTGDSRDLVQVLAFLGGKDVPEFVVSSICQPKRVWNVAGEVEERPAREMVPVLTNTDKLNGAIRQLKSLALISSKTGFTGESIISLDPKLQQHVEKSTTNPVGWKIQAARAVIHAFPTDRAVEPYLYAYLGTTLLPQLQIVLTSLGPDLLNLLSRDDLRDVVECCLSASRFSRPAWKHEAIAFAQSLTRTHLKDFHMSARLSLRQEDLHRLFQPDEQWLHDGYDTVLCSLAPSNPRSNAYFGELILARAQEMIDHNNLSGAWLELHKFHALDISLPSTQEQAVDDLIAFGKGKICRFQGKFKEAQGYFTPLLQAGPGHGALSPVASHLVAVFCELGDIDGAMKLMDIETEHMARLNRVCKGKAKRLKLTFANTHFMKALQLVTTWNNDLECYRERSGEPRNLRIPEEARESLTTAKRGYKELDIIYKEVANPGMVTKTNHFYVQAGLAIVYRLEGQLERALDYWNATAEAARKCPWEPGFAEMIIAYSKSEVTLSMDKTISDGLAGQARTLFHRSGRQYYFAGLGTLWFDLVGSLLSLHGGQKIVE